MRLSVGFRRRESTGRFPVPAVFRGSILHPLSQQGSRVITISRKTVVKQGWGKGELVIAGKGTSATDVEMDIREQWLAGHPRVARREGQTARSAPRSHDSSCSGE